METSTLHDTVVRQQIHRTFGFGVQSPRHYLPLLFLLPSLVLFKKSNHSWAGFVQDELVSNGCLGGVA